MCYVSTCARVYSLLALSSATEKDPWHQMRHLRKVVVVVCTVRTCLRNLRTKAVDDMTSCLHSTQNGSTIGLFRGTHNIIASRPHHNTVEDFLILGWMKRQRIICLLKPHYKKPSIFNIYHYSSLSILLLHMTDGSSFACGGQPCVYGPLRF